ncbi:hypothetical protein [Streptomyces adelaidensis]|uniref:hypothetical protein n=1 Tax=Streptomyces adelaidensis TaxID=2796465 RepID=UPI0019051F30|nr:hypothetical protein [Streptomyces adelaidensis]
MLEEATGDAVVLYRVRSEADAVLLNEVRHLIARRDGRLCMLTGRIGERGAPPPFGSDSLHHMVPDITEPDAYVCGPPAMTTAVLVGLRDAQVLARQVHAEKFGLPRTGKGPDARPAHTDPLQAEHYPSLTQSAPDEESKAEQSASPGEKPQVSDVSRCAPGRIRTCDTRFRSFPWVGLWPA